MLAVWNCLSVPCFFIGFANLSTGMFEIAIRVKWMFTHIIYITISPQIHHFLLFALLMESFPIQRFLNFAWPIFMWFCFVLPLNNTWSILNIHFLTPYGLTLFSFNLWTFWNSSVFWVRWGLILLSSGGISAIPLPFINNPCFFYWLKYYCHCVFNSHLSSDTVLDSPIGFTNLYVYLCASSMINWLEWLFWMIFYVSQVLPFHSSFACFSWQFSDIYSFI